MKTHSISLLLLLLFSITAVAQSDREDVIYMKNGSIYRGTIVEQIPSVSYKIEIAGGSVIVINATDVVKITKEPKNTPETEYQYRIVRTPKQIYEFHYRPRTWFIQAQALAEVAEIGLRLVGGYKFNQFGYLGLGIGIASLITPIKASADYAGAYVPVYLYYGGDIVQRHITPFYSLEAGYAFRPTLPDDVNYNLYGEGPLGGHGGFMAGAGFGVRFYSRRRVHFDISANVDIQMATENYEEEIYNQITGYSTNYFHSTTNVLIIPGLRFGIGF